MLLSSTSQVPWLLKQALRAGAGQGRAEMKGQRFPRVAAKRTQSLTWEGVESRPCVHCPSLLSADEIMSQFPSSKEPAGEQEDQPEDKKRPSL